MYIGTEGTKCTKEAYAGLATALEDKKDLDYVMLELGFKSFGSISVDDIAPLIKVIEGLGLKKDYYEE